MIADWWDAWNIRLGEALLKTTKYNRQGLTNSYQDRLRRLYVRLDAALLETRLRGHLPVSDPGR